MDDASDEVDGLDDDIDAQQGPEESENSDDLSGTVSTTLVEVAPGIAVLFGDVPAGVDLVDLGLIPSVDQANLSAALASIGNLGTITGNLAEAAAGAQGLYRVNEATLALLESGGELAMKDGAKLGAIFKNGKLIGQARFIPIGISAASVIAAVGPAVAMMGIQMQLGEISELARTNIALTTQTLKTIRNEQWSELEGLAEAIGEAFNEARQLGSVTHSVLDPVASSSPAVQKQLKLYRKNVTGHIDQLRRLDGHARREYLQSNAEAMFFDTHALLLSLKAYAEYRALRASLARTQSADDDTQSQLFDLITRTTPPEVDGSLRQIRELTGSLVRELRIIAELPGKATMPLTKKRRDSKTSRLTCRQLLDAIEPLAKALRPAVEMPVRPDIVCAPADLDLDPYLHVLRWFLEDGEQLQGVAFPYEPGVQKRARAARLVLAVPSLSAPLWLDSDMTEAIVDRIAPGTLVAVTDRRIITASPRRLLNHGELASVYPLGEVHYVRSRKNHASSKLPVLSITTERSDVQWTFPAASDLQQIDRLTTLMEDVAGTARKARGSIERQA